MLYIQYRAYTEIEHKYLSKEFCVCSTDALSQSITVVFFNKTCIGIGIRVYDYKVYIKKKVVWYILSTYSSAKKKKINYRIMIKSSEMRIFPFKARHVPREDQIRFFSQKVLV